MLFDNTVKEKLEKCLDIFPAIGIECISTFAGVSSRILQPWVILERLPGNNLHNVMLGAGNNLYQAIFAISFKSDEDMQLIPSSNVIELIDAWGEFANIYCGMLMDKDAFTENFGCLTQSMPQYSMGDVFYSKAWACCGKLVVDGGSEINMGYAIRKLLM